MNCVYYCAFLTSWVATCHDRHDNSGKQYSEFTKMQLQNYNKRLERILSFWHLLRKTKLRTVLRTVILYDITWELLAKWDFELLLTLDQWQLQCKLDCNSDSTQQSVGKQIWITFLKKCFWVECSLILRRSRSLTAMHSLPSPSDGLGSSPCSWRHRPFGFQWPIKKLVRNVEI